MKKIILAVMLFGIAVSASAADFSVAGVRDMDTTKGGVRVSASLGEVFNFSPTVSATSIDGAYVRYAAGTDFKVANVGPVALSVVGTGVYQNSSVGASGFGVTAGAKGVLPVTKTVSVVGGVEHFYGQRAVSSSNGNVVSLGLNLKF